MHSIAIRSLTGGVALAEVRARWTDLLGSVSHDQGGFSERVPKPRVWQNVGPEVVEAPAALKRTRWRSKEKTRARAQGAA